MASLNGPSPSVVLVGHYTHDLVLTPQGSHESLGGSVAYASSLFKLLNFSYQVVSKVGQDFKYHGLLRTPNETPQIDPLAHSKTTCFINNEILHERSCAALCSPITEMDLHPAIEKPIDAALAIGVAQEITPGVLVKLRQKSRFVLADIQGFIRDLNQKSVKHIPLHQTPYQTLLSCLDFLKVSQNELPFLDRSNLPPHLTLLITEGRRGCTLVYNKQEIHIPAPQVVELDPTGAGDSFLAGVTAGILRGLPLEKAAELGNRCGALAVTQKGIPNYSHSMVAGGLELIS